MATQNFQKLYDLLKRKGAEEIGDNADDLQRWATENPDNMNTIYNGLKALGVGKIGNNVQELSNWLNYGSAAGPQSSSVQPQRDPIKTPSTVANTQTISTGVSTPSAAGTNIGSIIGTAVGMGSQPEEAKQKVKQLDDSQPKAENSWSEILNKVQKGEAITEDERGYLSAGIMAYGKDASNMSPEQLEAAHNTMLKDQQFKTDVDTLVGENFDKMWDLALAKDKVDAVKMSQESRERNRSWSEGWKSSIHSDMALPFQSEDAVKAMASAAVNYSPLEMVEQLAQKVPEEMLQQAYQRQLENLNHIPNAAEEEELRKLASQEVSALLYQSVLSHGGEKWREQQGDVGMFLQTMAEATLMPQFYRMAAKEKAKENAADRVADTLPEDATREQRRAAYETAKANEKNLNTDGLDPMLQAQAMWSEDHPVVSAIATGAGMTMDPTMAIGAGVGGWGTRLAGSLLGRTVSKVGVGVGERVLQMTGSKLYKVGTGIVGGGMNFATFEGLHNVVDQLGDDTRDFSIGDVFKTAGHGFLTGAAAGGIGGLVGIGTEALAGRMKSNTSRILSRIAGNVAGFEGEALAFSLGDILDPDADGWDAFMKNQGMVLGFKLFGAAKGLGKNIIEGKDPRTYKPLMQQLYERMAAPGERGLREDEVQQLRELDYGDVADEMRDSKAVANFISHMDEKVAKPAEGAAEGTSEGQPQQQETTRLEQFMADERVPKAIRQKVAWIATGENAPLPPVAQTRTDGNTVTTYDYNGGIIEQRTFDNENQRDWYIKKARHQAELGLTELAEASREREIKEKQLDQIRRGIAQENVFDYDFITSQASLENQDLRKKVNRGEALTKEDTQWNAILQWIHKKANEWYNENGKSTTEDEAHPDNVRADVNERFKIDIDKALAKDADKRTDMEKLGISEYLKRLDEDFDNSYGQGGYNRSLKEDTRNARRLGKESTDDKAVKMQLMYDVAREDFEQAFGMAPEEYFGEHLGSVSATELMNRMRNGGTPKEKLDVAERFFLGWSGAFGVSEGIEQRAQEAGEARKAEIQPTIHTDGSIYQAQLKDGRSVFIVDGNVKVGKKGSKTIVEDVTVYDPQSGNKEISHGRDMSGVARIVEDGAQHLEEQAAIARDQYKKKETERVQGNLTFEPGERAYVEGAVGVFEKATIQGTDPDSGDVLVRLDGGMERLYSRESLNHSNKEGLKDEYRRFIREEEAKAQASEQVDENRISGGGIISGGEPEPRVSDDPMPDYKTGTFIGIDENGREREGVISDVDPNNGVIEWYWKDDFESAKETNKDPFHWTVSEEFHKMVKSWEPDQKEGQRVEEQPTEAKTEAPEVAEEQQQAVPAAQEATPAPAALQPKEEIPTRKEGRKTVTDYTAVSPERTHESIYNEMELDEEEANDFVNGKIASVDKAIKDNAKKKPKASDYSEIADYKAAKAKWSEENQRLEEEQQHWQNVLDIHNNKPAEEAKPEEVKVEEAPKAEEPVTEEAKAVPEEVKTEEPVAETPTAEAPKDETPAEEPNPASEEVKAEVPKEEQQPKEEVREESKPTVSNEAPKEEAPDVEAEAKFKRIEDSAYQKELKEKGGEDKLEMYNNLLNNYEKQGNKEMAARTRGKIRAIEEKINPKHSVLPNEEKTNGRKQKGGFIHNEHSKKVSRETASLLDTTTRNLGYTVRFGTREETDGAYGVTDLGKKEIVLDKGLLDLEDGAERVIRTVFGHEITHVLRQTSGDFPELWGTFMKAVKDVMGDNFKVTFDDYKRQYDEYHKSMGWKPLPTDEIEEEVAVQLAGQRLMTDDDFMRRVLDKVAENKGDAKGLVKRIRNSIQGLINRLRKTFGLHPNAQQRDVLKRLEDLKDVWQGMYEYAAAKQSESQLKEQSGIDLKDNGSVRFSLRFDVTDLIRDGRQKILQESVKAGLLTEKMAQECDDFINHMEDRLRNDILFGVIKDPMFLQYQVRPPLRQHDGKKYQNQGWVKTNAEYPMNIDPSFSCIKRDDINALLNLLYGRKLLSLIGHNNGDYAKLKKIAKKHGMVVTCEGCFVDQARDGAFEWAQRVSDIWNKIVNAGLGEGVATEFSNSRVKENAPFDKKAAMAMAETYAYVDAANKAKGGNEFDYTPQGLEKAKKYLKDAGKEPKKTYLDTAKKIIADPALRHLVNPNDLIAPNEYWDCYLFAHPEVKAKLQSLEGMGSPKLLIPNSTYEGEIQGKWKGGKKFGNAIEFAYNTGGVRVQSASDFRGALFPDYCQVFGDLASKALPGQSYSKVVYFPRLFGMTGLKINMSLFPAGDVPKDLRAKWHESVKKEDFSYKNTPEFLKLAERAGLDANGDYFLSSESFPIDEAFGIVSDERYKANCGCVMVAVSDAHYWKSAKDPRIQYIIPYHDKIGDTLGLVEPRSEQDTDIFTNSMNHQNTCAPGAGFEKLPDETYQQYYRRIAQGVKAEKGDTPETLAKKAEEKGYLVDKPSYGKKLYGGIHIKDKDGEKFNLYQSLKETNDPVESSKRYVELCQKNGWIPIFPDKVYDPETGEFSKYYYKLLGDWSLCDVDGKFRPQEAIKMDAEHMPEEWHDILMKCLEEQAQKRGFIKADENLDKVITEFFDYLGLAHPDMELPNKEDVLKAAAEIPVDGSIKSYKDPTPNESGLTEENLKAIQRQEPQPQSKDKKASKKTAKHSIIGVKGAENLDISEGKRERVNNRETAIRMEKEGKHPEDIRMATGWQRGKDGNWRYETDHYPDPTEFVQSHAEDFRKAKEAADALGDKRLTMDDIKGAAAKFKLSEVIPEDDEIFSAYPEFKDVDVYFDFKMYDGGGWNPKENRMILSIGDSYEKGDMKEIRDSLIHELQHAIQRKEGFTPGSSMKRAEEYIEKKREELNQQRQDIRDLFHKGLISREVAEEQLQPVLAGLRDLHNDYGVYRRQAGEVEARNAAARANMSLEERRDSMLEDTEDVARIDQLLYGEQSDDPQQFIGKKAREAYEKLLADKRPELPRKMRNEALDYLHSLADTKENTKRIKTAINWFAKGSVRLPEDMYKIDQALSVAEKAKVDPMRYESPMALLEAHADIKPTRKRINPDDVPTLSNKTEMGDGVVVYDVDESDESRRAMREIIDTHWGEDANPWCLLARTGSSGISGTRQYWDFYNKTPKKAAFRNGELLAFSASHTPEVQWWDRQDQPSERIRYTTKFTVKDGSKRTAEYEVGNKKPIRIFQGDKSDGLYKEWDKDGNLQLEANYKGGKLNGESTYYGEIVQGEDYIMDIHPFGDIKNNPYLKDRDVVRVAEYGRYEDGFLTGPRVLVNTENGIVIRIIDPKDEPFANTAVQYHPDGTLKSVHFPKNDKNQEWTLGFSEDGQMISAFINSLGEPYFNIGYQKDDYMGRFAMDWDTDTRVFYDDSLSPIGIERGYRDIGKFDENGSLVLETDDYVTRKSVQKILDFVKEVKEHERQVYSDGYDNGTKVAKKLMGDRIPEPKRRHSIIGTKGAQALDAAEKKKKRMKALEMAEKLEREFKDEEAIWAATGWQRGKDGKWRYEEANERFGECFEKFFGKSLADYKGEYRDALHKWAQAKEGSKIRENLWNDLKVIESKVKKSVKKNTTLQKLLGKDHPILVAYPEMADYKVSVGWSANGDSGSFNPSTGRIYINAYQPDQVESFAHELQHAIQHLEGFSSGANKDNAKAYSEKRLVQMKEYKREIRSKVESGELTEAEAKEKLKGYSDEYFNLQNIDEVYRRQAGETEARNAETRLNMSLEDRRNSMISSTEDVSRSEQLLYEYDPKTGQVSMKLGKKAREAYEKLLAERRPELSRRMRNKALDYLHSLADTKENTKRIKTAVNWLAKGTVRLPEDMYKIDQALSVAEKAKVDPMQYDSPQDLLETHTDIKPSVPRIDPDKVPTLTDKKEFAGGVTVYEVDESDESRQAMREIIDTHWGYDANPWCLLARDKNGSIEESLDFWEDYSGTTKKVAFQNGKLLAFCANTEEGDLWWNRMDQESTYIPYTKPFTAEDGTKRKAVYDALSKEESLIKTFVGERKKPGDCKEWDHKGDLIFSAHYDENGKPDGEMYERYYDLVNRNDLVDNNDYNNFTLYDLENGAKRKGYTPREIEEYGYSVHGKPEGDRFKIDVKNGNPISYVHYDNGKRNGPSIEKYPSGKVCRLCVWDKGTPTYYTTYDTKGSLIYASSSNYDLTQKEGYHIVRNSKLGITAHIPLDYEGKVEIYHDGKAAVLDEDLQLIKGQEAGLKQEDVDTLLNWHTAALMLKDEYDGYAENALEEKGFKINRRHSLIGYLGAMRLDDAEKRAKTNEKDRRESFRMAEEMERDAKDERVIWTVTGWERGKDGNWRYETDHYPDPTDFVQSHAEDFRKAKEAADALDTNTYTMEDIKNAAAKFKLSEVIPEDDEIFTAYPEFKDIDVYFDFKMFDGGGWNPKENRMILAIGDAYEKGDMKEIRDSLIHELQHAVQRAEGFVPGSSMKRAEEYIEKKREELNQQRQDIRDLFHKGLISREVAEEQLQPVLAGLRDLHNDYGVYRRQAGEVEARNAAARANMSLEERRDSMLEDTEDVARIDQLLYGEGSDDPQLYIGKKAREAYEKLLAEQRPRMSKKKRDEALDYLHSLADTKENTKRIKTAVNWLAKGSVRLPEDMFRIDAALSVAEKAKVDPMRYESPDALMNAHAEIRPSRPRINPDEVPTLTNKRELSDGIVVYDVQESEKSRMNMRDIIDTHWGEDANPWCLLARTKDKNGEVNMKQSRKYWKHYSSIPKQVAFKDGKLIAFHASDDNKEKWWDRNDRSSTKVRYTKKNVANDGTRCTAVYEEGKPDKPLYSFAGESGKEGTYKRWDSEGELRYECTNNSTGRLEGVTMRSDNYYPHASSGSEMRDREFAESDPEKLPYIPAVEYASFTDGLRHGPRVIIDKETGNVLSYQEWRNGRTNGLQTKYYEDGSLKSIYRSKDGSPEGMASSYYEDGSLSYASKDFTDRKNPYSYTSYWAYEGENREAWDSLTGLKVRFDEDLKPVEAFLRKKSLGEFDFSGKFVPHEETYVSESAKDGIAGLVKFTHEANDLKNTIPSDPREMLKGAIKDRIPEPQRRHSIIMENQDYQEELTKQGKVSYRELDPKDEFEKDIIRQLHTEGEYITVYRTMQIIDGKLYSPMAAGVGSGKKATTTPEIKLFVPEAAEEHPELVYLDENGEAKIKISKKTTKSKELIVAYNPYIHTSYGVLNDQFTAAWNRPNLVVVECRVPKSELTSGYKADVIQNGKKIGTAKDAVGELAWHSGPVAGQLAKKGDPRRVVLSRYDMPVRVLSNREVAEKIHEQIKDYSDINLPWNLFHPEVKSEMEKMGHKFNEEASGIDEDFNFDEAREWTKKNVNPVTDEDVERINREHREMADRTPEGKQRALHTMSEHLKVPVTVLNSDEDIKGTSLYKRTKDEKERQRMLNSKGWFDHTTGEIVINMGKHDTAGDVAETILHEAVGHKGFREIFGEEGNTQLWNEVYDNLADDVRDRVNQLAGKYGYRDFAEATEEYAANLAQKGFKDFDHQEYKFWKTIRKKVVNAINKIFEKLNIRLGKDKLNINDNELRQLLWNSYDHLVKGDLLQRAEDLARRQDILDEEAKADASFRDGDDPIWGEQSPLTLRDRMLAETLRQEQLHQSDRRLRQRAVDDVIDNLKDLVRDMRNRQGRARSFQGADQRVETQVGKAAKAVEKNDVQTADRMKTLVRILNSNGYLQNLGKQDLNNLMKALSDSVGKDDVKAEVDRVLDVVTKNLLSRANEAFGKALTLGGTRVNSKGVDALKELDPRGVVMMEALSKGMKYDEATLNQLIQNAQNDMGHPDPAKAEDAADRFAGLTLAHEWLTNVKQLQMDELQLRDQIAIAEDEYRAGRISKDQRDQMVQAYKDAIRDNHLQRISNLEELTGRIYDEAMPSAQRAIQWRQQEKQRIEEIHHNANSDLQGVANEAQRKDSRVQRFMSSSATQFFLKPLCTFEQMLRQFGSKSVDGEGYLYDRFMRGWVDANQTEYVGYTDACTKLNRKSAELFGQTRGLHKRDVRFADINSIIKNLPKMTATITDEGKPREMELDQGQLLYLWMIDKMSDGRMKLRAMDIGEDQIQAIDNFLDPRLKEMGDWLQNNFLPESRRKYNETHRKVFGANMAAIDSYFPLKIQKNALTREVQATDPDNEPPLGTAVTGAIKRRKVNTQPIDIINCNAFDVMADHVREMEHWNAFAQWDRDMTDLLSYKSFRNKVMNMTTVYGGGKQLFDSFRHCAQMASGSYQPTKGAIDKGIVQMGKMVTMAKISGRMYTAFKQLMSFPAYFSDASAWSLAKNSAHAIDSWKWCAQNLPMFRKRWESRMVGETRLKTTQDDYNNNLTKAVETLGKWGMSPNAAVDALTVAIGARSIYETKFKQYKREHFSDEDAKRLAIQDAETAYNLTQQSSEGAFTSTIQVDRTAAAVALSVFRNASMAYQRQLFDSYRNLIHMATPGYKQESLEFMKKKLERQGLNPRDAEAAAKMRYRRQLTHDLVRVGLNGFLLQFTWNLASYLPYLFCGDDDQKKKEMLADAARHAALGAQFEGLTGGNIGSEALNMLGKGESLSNYDPTTLPMFADLKNLVKKFGSDKVAAFTDLINLAAQIPLGMNPDTGANIAVGVKDLCCGVLDACKGDPDAAREAMMSVMQILNCPTSQIDEVYFDAIGRGGRTARNMTPRQIAERYAVEKVKRGALWTSWAYDDFEEGKALEKKRQKANQKMKERLYGIDPETDELINDHLDQFNREKDKMEYLKTLQRSDPAEYKHLYQELLDDGTVKHYNAFKTLNANLERYAKAWLEAPTAEKADEIALSIYDMRQKIAKALSKFDTDK